MNNLCSLPLYTGRLAVPDFAGQLSDCESDQALYNMQFKNSLPSFGKLSNEILSQSNNLMVAVVGGLLFPYMDMAFFVHKEHAGKNRKIAPPVVGAAENFNA